LFLPKVILATPTLNITKVPDSATIEESFSVEVVIVSLEPKEKYLIKAVGGESWYDVKTWSDKTDKWLAWNGAWDEMPETVALDDGTNISTISAKFIDTTTLGENQLKIKIVKWDEKSKPFYSNVVVIDVLPTPTPELTEEPEPMEEPEPTDTPTPTSTPIPTPTPKAIKVIGATLSGEVLGEESTPGGIYLLEPSPSPEASGEGITNNKTLPVIFLGVGLVFFVAAGLSLWYTKWRCPG